MTVQNKAPIIVSAIANAGIAGLMLLTFIFSSDLLGEPYWRFVLGGVFLVAIVAALTAFLLPSSGAVPTTTDTPAQEVTVTLVKNDRSVPTDYIPRSWSKHKPLDIIKLFARSTTISNEKETKEVVGRWLRVDIVIKGTEKYGYRGGPDVYYVSGVVVDDIGSELGVVTLEFSDEWGKTVEMLNENEELAVVGRIQKGRSLSLECCEMVKIVRRDH